MQLHFGSWLLALEMLQFVKCCEHLELGTIAMNTWAPVVWSEMLITLYTLSWGHDFGGTHLKQMDQLALCSKWHVVAPRGKAIATSGFTSCGCLRRHPADPPYPIVWSICKRNWNRHHSFGLESFQPLSLKSLRLRKCHAATDRSRQCDLKNASTTFGGQAG
jgi:hypothetical protein